MTRGRPSNTEPKTAFDYRRYITLVQTLATGDDRKIYALCEAWGVEPVPAVDVTISRLAKHAIEYHRQEQH